MTRATRVLGFILLAGVGSAAWAQVALPVVADAEPEPLRAQCQRLREAIERLRAAGADVDPELRAALGEAARSPAAPAGKIQRLLDPFCLVLVTINPESRVKALRGPAPARLKQGREVLLLVKVVNEGGVTHALGVRGPQLRSGGGPPGAGWLEAAAHAEAPLTRDLSGRGVEYRILGLKAHEAGKREATLQFDVGQGTQDLGFRAEVPILFTVQREDDKVTR